MRNTILLIFSFEWVSSSLFPLSIRSDSICKGSINGSNRTNSLDMTLNCIWWSWGSSPGAFWNGAYPFIAISLWPSLTRRGSTCKGSIYRSNRTNSLDMPLNCIWWWGSSPRAWGIWHIPSLPFLSDPLWPGEVVLVRTNSLDMILNWILLWGSNPGVLRNLEYPFIGITSWFTLIKSCNTC